MNVKEKLEEKSHKPTRKLARKKLEIAESSAELDAEKTDSTGVSNGNDISYITVFVDESMNHSDHDPMCFDPDPLSSLPEEAFVYQSEEENYANPVFNALVNAPTRINIE